jgi:hypothetical protein
MLKGGLLQSQLTMYKVETPGALGEFVRKRPWAARFEAIKTKERFFNWELEFPELAFQERGGFDVVLGNPPWEKVLPDRYEFYGTHDLLLRALEGGELDQRIRELDKQNPGLEAEYIAYRDRINLIADVLKQDGNFEYGDWKLNGKTTGGHQDLFKFFVERAWQVLKPAGKAGLVLPSAVYNNEGCTGIRHLLLENSRIERFYGFENRRKIFPIDSRFKFISLTFSKQQPDPNGFPAAFMRHDLEELKSDDAQDWTVWVKKPELEFLSPGTLTFMEFRTVHDQKVLEKMHFERKSLGSKDSGWGFKFRSEYNMTNDKDLWTTSAGKLINVKHVLGKESLDMDRARERMAKKGFWPLYEGKQIEQFVIDLKPIERWVDIEKAEKSKRMPNPDAKVVFRDIASNTNERTCIAAVLPAGSCFGHTLSGIEADVSADTVTALFNSLAFDFAVRLRTAGTHLSFTYLSRLPLPTSKPTVKIKTRSVNGSGEHILDDEKLWPKLVDLYTEVGESYGLNNRDLLICLESFRVQSEKRPEFITYLKDRLKQN